MISPVKPSETNEPQGTPPFENFDAAAGRYVGPETTDRINNLLAEYSQKLKTSSQEIERRRIYSLAIMIFTALSCGLLGGLIMLICSKFILKDAVSYPYNLIPILLLFLIMIVTVTVSLFAKRIGKREGHKEYLLEENLIINARHLKKAVQTASQIGEHAERDIGRRLELDLRLAEAETLLNYVRLQTEPKSKLGWL